MKFTTLIALVGAASAVYPSCRPACEQPEEPACAPKIACGCAGGAGGYGRGGRRGLSGMLDASSRLPAASYGSDNYARLCTEAANSNTQISASQMTIPDKNTCTDQAKVSQAVSNGNTQEKNCEVAQRKFSIGGEITVTEKYTNQQKGESSSEQCGEGASQTRSRVQVMNNCCGKAAIPVTANCAGGAGGAAGCKCCCK